MSSRVTVDSKQQTVGFPAGTVNRVSSTISPSLQCAKKLSELVATASLLNPFAVLCLQDGHVRITIRRKGEDDPGAAQKFLEDAEQILEEARTGEPARLGELARQIQEILTQFEQRPGFLKTTAIQTLFQKIFQKCSDSLCQASDRLITGFEDSLGQAFERGVEADLEAVFDAIERDMEKIESSIWFSSKMVKCPELGGRFNRIRDQLAIARVNLTNARVVQKQISALVANRFLRKCRDITSDSPVGGLIRPGSVKTYIDPQENGPVADVGLTKIGSGAFKAVKSVLRILPSGEMRIIARYHALNKGQRLLSFIPEMEKELAARRNFGLDQVDGVLKLNRITYVNRAGKTKYRYCSECCEGTLDNVLAETPSRAQRAKAESIALAALKVLLEIHSKGLIHADIKPENVLYRGSRVFIGDFALSVKDGAEGRPVGSPPFRAPEIVLNACLGRPNVFSAERDAFSFGMLLSCIIDNSAVSALAQTTMEFPQGTKTAEQFVQQIRDHRDALLQKASSGESLEGLAYLLLDPDPKTRLSLKEAYPILQRIVSRSNGVGT